MIRWYDDSDREIVQVMREQKQEVKQQKQEVKQENLKDAKAPKAQEESKEAPKTKTESSKPTPEPEKPKQETTEKVENRKQQEPDLKNAQAPRDFYKTGNGTQVPGEVPQNSTRAEDKSSSGGSSNKGESLGGSRKAPQENKTTDGERPSERDQGFLKGKEEKTKAFAEKEIKEGVEERKVEPGNREQRQSINQSEKSNSDRVNTDSTSSKPPDRSETRASEYKPAQVRDNAETRIPDHIQPKDVTQAKLEEPQKSLEKTERLTEIKPLEKATTGTVLSERLQGEPIVPKTQPVELNVPQQKSLEQTATPRGPSVIRNNVPEVRVSGQASGKAPLESSVSGPPKAIEQVVAKAEIPSKVSRPPEVMVRLTAQIVERFPVRAEPPTIKQRRVVAQKRREIFKSKVLDAKKIPAPNDRIRELVAAVREVSLQRNVVRTKCGIEAKKELLKDSTSLLRRLRAEDRNESSIFKSLKELDRLVVKYSPPLAVKTGVERRIEEKLPELRKAPEIMIKVFETITAISTSAERLLSKLRDPSVEKLLPPETISKLQGLIQELVRSSLPLGTDLEGLTPERIQSLKSKIEELIAKMREELLHLDLNSDDISELIDILESLNELEALEELLLEELILLEEPSTFEEVLQEENVIILPEEPEEEVEEVFVVEGWVIDSVTELGISGVEVFGGLIGREITDSDGYFAFTNIPKNTFLTIGLDPDIGKCEPEVFSVTVYHNEMVRFFVTR
jgi:hypothetical protein